MTPRPTILCIDDEPETLMLRKNLLEMHGLEVIHARRIPTHGGSIRGASSVWCRDQSVPR